MFNYLSIRPNAKISELDLTSLATGGDFGQGLVEKLRWHRLAMKVSVTNFP